MNINQLETYVKVVDEGSFSKAAEKLYVSPTAIIKQVNILENEIGTALLKRTHRGIQLTDAGKSFYKDAKHIIKLTNDAIERTRHKGKNQNHFIRVGTSITTPSQCILELLPRIHEIDANLKFRFVSFENTPENAVEILKHLGDNIDIIAGVYSPKYIKERLCMAQKLYEVPLCIAMSIYHPLADKEWLEIEDLYNQNLMVIHRGWNEFVDEMRDDLTKNHSHIHIEDFSFYNLETFNYCESTQSLMIGFEFWKQAHPLMKIVPVNWSYSVPFGIHYSLNPTFQVQSLIQIIKKIYPNI